jgi:hypothetical protein
MLESWPGMEMQGNVVVMISAYPGVQQEKSTWSLLIGFFRAQEMSTRPIIMYDT